METQLDLFLDSRAVALANDAARAVVARDAERACAAVAMLRAEAGDHPCLEALETLASGLAAWDPPRADAAAIANAADWLDRVVAPAASQALGEDAGAFLAGFFRELAEAARGVAYEPARPNAHRAWLCLRAGEWEEAERAVAAIPQVEANPDALHWRAVARYRHAGLEAARPALFALAWGAPQRLAPALAELADELLQREWDRFEGAGAWEDLNEKERPAWFPAWYLVEHPGAGTVFEAMRFPDAPPAEAARVILELLRLEKRGDARLLAGKRARLRDLDQDLFSLYMANRATRYL